MSDEIKTDEKALLPKGICVASNRIMTDGKPVGWAYREAVKKDGSSYEKLATGEWRSMDLDPDE